MRGLAIALALAAACGSSGGGGGGDQGGWTFTDDGVDLGITGVSPGATLLADGSVRLYVSDQNGGTVYEAADGLHFAVEAGGPGTIPGTDPTVLRLANGTYRGYFVNQAPGSTTKVIVTATSADGLRFGPVTGTGITNASAVSSQAWGVPTAVLTPDGRYRLFWVTPVGGQLEQVSSATSGDGVAFTQDDGARTTGGYVDPQILAADAGRWVGIFSTSPALRPQTLHLGTSSDGLAWSVDPSPIVTVAGGRNALDPTSVPLGPNRFRVYYSVSQGTDPLGGTFTVRSGVLQGP